MLCLEKIHSNDKTAVAGDYWGCNESTGHLSAQSRTPAHGKKAKRHQGLLTE